MEINPGVLGIYLTLGVTMVVAALVWFTEATLLQRAHIVYAPLVIASGFLFCQGQMLYGHWLQVSPEMPLTAIINGYASNCPGLVSWITYFIPLYTTLACLWNAWEEAKQERRNKASYQRELPPAWQRASWN